MSETEAGKPSFRLTPDSPDAPEDVPPYPAYGKSAEDVQRMENRVLGRMMLELRQSARLSLDRISEQTGHSPDHIRAIEEGRVPLLLRTFIIVTDMADVPIDLAATEALTHLDRLHYPRD